VAHGNYHRETLKGVRYVPSSVSWTRCTAHWLGAVVFAVVPQLVEAEAARCAAFFDEDREVATCRALVNLSSVPISDPDLRELVSQQVHGKSYAVVEKEKEWKRERQRQASSEKAAAQQSDRCASTFKSKYEADICRWSQIFSGVRQTDMELRSSVTSYVTRMRSDHELKGRFVGAIRDLRHDPEQDRVYAQEIDGRLAEEAAKASARRRKEAELRASAAKSQANALNTALGVGKVGFLSMDWKLGGFGTVLIARFMLQNNTDSVAKDFQVACDTAGESGTRLSAVQQVVYSEMAPKERRSFELNMGQVHPQSHRVACRLTSWK
jgi:hypothetical protein